MLFSRRVFVLLAATALFAVACSSGDDVEVTVDGQEITEGDVLERLEDTAGDDGSVEGVVGSEEYDSARADLEVEARERLLESFWADHDVAAASVGGAAITVGDLSATFEESGIAVEALTRNDINARLRNLLLISVFEQAFTDLGFDAGGGNGSYDERGAAVDALVVSPEFSEVAEEWLASSATEAQQAQVSFCIGLVVSENEERAVAYGERIADGESIDLVAAELAPGDTGGDDCRSLDGFPPDVGTAILELEMGETSGLLEVAASEGFSGGETFAFIRLNSLENVGALYLVEASRMVEVEIHPALGVWDSVGLAIGLAPAGS